MPQADIEPAGRWERLIQPMRNKFTLRSDLGLTTNLDPDASKATAEAFESMARYIDLCEAHERLRMQLLKSVGGALLLIAALVALAWLA